MVLLSEPGTSPTAAPHYLISSAQALLFSFPPPRVTPAPLSVVHGTCVRLTQTERCCAWYAARGMRCGGGDGWSVGVVCQGQHAEAKRTKRQSPNQGHSHVQAWRVSCRRAMQQRRGGVCSMRVVYRDL